jgi:uncharacterized membrane protein YgcG
MRAAGETGGRQASDPTRHGLLARAVAAGAAALLLLVLPAGPPASAAPSAAGPATPRLEGGPAAASPYGALAAAAARSWHIQDFHSEIRVYRSGRMDVDETLKIQFEGTFHGIYRDFPVRYNGPGGFDYRLFTSVKGVEDGQGRALKYETSRHGGDLRIKIYIPGAENATRTVTIHYRIQNGLRFFDDYDELYWNVTGDQWPVPIDAASATIHLPVEVTGVRAKAYTGAFGSRAQNANVQVTGSMIHIATDRPLDMHEGLTADVAWGAGVVQRPTFLTKVGWFLRSNWPLGLPLLVFPAMFGIWWKRGRDPRLRPIAAQYEPPDGLTPGEEGVLVDDSPDMRDITATLVDLAVRGFVTIEEHDSKKYLGLIGTKQDYAFDLERQKDQWEGLAAHERALLDGLFDGGTTQHVELEDLEDRFYKKLSGIKDDLFDALMARGYYGRRPDRVRGMWLGVAFVGTILCLMGGLKLANHFAFSGLAVGVGVVLSGLVVAAFGWLMPAKTVAGTRALEAVLGFEEFLKRVEEPRFQKLIKGPQDFERFLPHAMALGVEKSWAKAFEGIYTEPPSWYRGTSPTGFNTGLFVASLGNMSTRTSSVMTSQPRSSSGSSGFGGGGGFSGGGFGGGGGGAF